MIKNIIFDLGNVILNGKAISVVKKITKTKEEQELIEKYFFNENIQKLDFGYMTLEEYYKICNIPDCIKKYKKQLIEYYKYRKYNEEIIDLIKILKNNNYKIYILSDNNKETYEYLKQQEKFKNIDGWILSCDYHHTKKEKEIYEILIKKYNIIPNECVFIDDKKENIELAKQLGINGFILNYKQDNINKLKEYLEKMKINIKA